MIDMRWTPTDTFETACRQTPGAELVRLFLSLCTTLAERVRAERGHEGFGGVAGPIAS